MSDQSAANLARNIRALRELHRLTQQQLADRAEVPRPTLATLESGSANPTLQVLVKVASALQVSLEELVGPPRDTGRIWTSSELKRLQRQGATISHLLPDRVSGVEIERIELAHHKGMRGSPHTAGTREYCFCESGSLVVTVSGESFTLLPGDVVAFRGDQHHSYRCVTEGDVTVGFCVIGLSTAV